MTELPAVPTVRDPVIPTRLFSASERGARCGPGTHAICPHAERRHHRRDDLGGTQRLSTLIRSFKYLKIHSLQRRSPTCLGDGMGHDMWPRRAG
jgi:hypothetical protein